MFKEAAKERTSKIVRALAATTEMAWRDFHELATSFPDEFRTRIVTPQDKESECQAASVLNLRKPIEGGDQCDEECKGWET